MSTTQPSISNLSERLDEAACLLDVIVETFANEAEATGKHILIRRIQADIRAVEADMATLFIGLDDERVDAKADLDAKLSAG